MTIFKEINSYEAQHLLSCMGYSISELEDLAPASWENIHPMCGIADVTLDKSSMSLKYYGIRYDRYTIYLRMEPLTLCSRRVKFAKLRRSKNANSGRLKFANLSQSKRANHKISTAQIGCSGYG